MNEPRVMRLRERSRGLLEEVDDAFLRPWTIDLDDLVERCTFQKLHSVIEDTVRSAAIVEDGHGVGMSEHRGTLDLALETSQSFLSSPVG